ncbi:MAG: hypothetical protein EZS26_001978 [Candidatus Ordinivivax streblomastigis]|uniref:Uncharacterized protein n=1 Tax=Candidatus Ordinivivax streblomastigis TaxID=2540710 RepID=A0A5M8P058_9BACT|nr:MAG: hypothetical protein EZS26_001978 [Candidatus Ordinivivax streblomastigis]
MDTKDKKTNTKKNKNFVISEPLAETDNGMLSKIGLYWRTEYRKGWIKDMRAVLK